MPLRRLFFCRKEYSQLVLLAFFLAQPSSARDVLARDSDQTLRLRALCAENPVVAWQRCAEQDAIAGQGNARFWYARGAFKAFLDRLGVVLCAYP